MFNKNELILDKVRSLVANDLETKKMLFRLTTIEEPSLNCTAEGEEVTDAIGALITTIYRAKKATFAGTNSLISLDLAAAQYGASKEIATEENKVAVSTYEILTVEEGATTIKVKHQPVVDSIKFIYLMEDKNPATAYKVGAVASETEAVVAEDGTITLPTSVTSGKIYVQYDYLTTEALRVVNKASNFPEACELTIFALFKDVCNENKVYAGSIHCPKAKLNPEQIELALTSTGKHAFEFQMMRDYCAEEGEDELFSIVIAE